jgi:hypothetical protein
MIDGLALPGAFSISNPGKIVVIFIPSVIIDRNKPESEISNGSWSSTTRLSPEEDLMRWKEGAEVEGAVATVRGLLPSEWLSESARSVFVLAEVSVRSDPLEVAVEDVVEEVVEEVVNEESAEEEVGVCVGDPAPNLSPVVLEDEDVADDVATEEEGEEGVGSVISISFFTFIASLPLLLTLPLPVSLFNDIISFNAAGIAFAAFAPFTALAAFTGGTTTGAGLVK